MAQQLQENRLLQEILKQREADTIATWRAANTVEGRETCWQAVRQIDSLRGAINARIHDILAGDGRESGNTGD